jgi:rubrerythrin
MARAQIMNKIEEIDLRDGKADGKESQPTVCPDCGHTISKRRSNCFYCGARIPSFGFNR